MLKAYPAVGCRNEEKGLLAFPVVFPEAKCFQTLWRSAEAGAWQRETIGLRQHGVTNNVFARTAIWDTQGCAS